MNIYNVTFKQAKEILEKLDKKFKLVFLRNKTAVHGNTISAIIRKMQSGNRYYVEIQSSFFNDSSILSAIDEYNDSYFLSEKK